MLKKIVETTAIGVFGSPTSKRMLKVTSGQYLNRMMAVIQTATNDIRFWSSDPPYLNWSEPTLIAEDSDNCFYDAVIDSSGDVYVVYCEQGSSYLVVRKLTFAAGAWTVGAKIYVYNGTLSQAPSLEIDGEGRMWVSWSRLSSGYFDIQVKTSDDGGATWGSGPSDAGDTLKAGMPIGYSRLLVTSSRVYVVYVGTGTDILVRSRLLSGGEWTSEYTVATGTEIDEHFDAAVSSDGVLGVVFDDGQLRYREYDGSNWAAITTLDSAEATHPQLSFVSNVPAVCYLSEVATGQRLIKSTDRRSGVFSTPELLDCRHNMFDAVIVYDSSACSYVDVTSAAADSTAADVWHPNSGCMLRNIGDELYMGMTQPFRFVRFVLSSAGVGGSVIWSYWDGSNWKSFVPSGGAFNLETTDKKLVLWDDLLSVPSDWQQCAVNGETRFWVRVRVASDFSTGPVGSMITAISNIEALVVRR